MKCFWFLVCSLLFTRWSCVQSRAGIPDIESHYNSATHFWNFSSTTNITDSKDPRQGLIAGDLSTVVSPSGTGLRVTEGSVIKLKPGGFKDECPANPWRCKDGFSVSLLLRIKGIDYGDNTVRFILGNIYKDSLESDLGKQMGFMIGISRKKFQVFVTKSNHTLCEYNASPALKNTWLHFGLVWRDDFGSDIAFYVNERLYSSYSVCHYLDQFSFGSNRSIDVGSVNTTKPTVTVEVDNLAMWNRALSRSEIVRPWLSITDSWANYRRADFAVLGVKLLNLPWNPVFSDSTSTEVRDLQGAFREKFTKLFGNNCSAVISTFSHGPDGNVTAEISLRFNQSTLWMVKSLQDTFRNRTLLKTVIKILHCNSSLDVFCHPPEIVGFDRWSSALRAKFRHNMSLDQVPLFKHYIVVYHKLGRSLWEHQTFTISMLPLMNDVEFRYLKPYTNYTVELFPCSFQGTGLGSDQEIVQTREGGPSVAPNITSLYNTSSTSLHVTWIHSIPPEAYNGILIGYRIRWDSITYVEVGLEVNNVTIEGLHEYTLYYVYVSGRTNGGAGAENYLQAWTDEDVPSEGPDSLRLTATSPRSLLAEWTEVSFLHRNGIIRGYHVRCFDPSQQIPTTDVTVDPSIMEYKFVELLPYHTYSVSVTAFTNKGDGPPSEKMGLTGELAPLEPPDIQAVEPLSSTSIRVSWTFDDSRENVPGILGGFNINYTSLDGVTLSSGTLQVDVSTFAKVTGLRPYTKYNVSVGAFTGAGATYSSAVEKTTLEDVPEAPPASVMVHNISSTAIKVQWDEIPKESRNGIILEYHVDVFLASDLSLERTSVFPPSTRETIVTDLQSFTAYQVKVYGSTIAGDGVHTAINVTTDVYDLDECESQINNCHDFAECINTLGSFHCRCLGGTTGSGVACTDLDECLSDPCQSDETCINGNGSFFCLLATNVQDFSSCTTGSIATILNVDKNISTSTIFRKTDRQTFSTLLETNCSSVRFEWNITNITVFPLKIELDKSLTVGHQRQWNDFTSLQYGTYLLMFTMYSGLDFVLDWGFFRVIRSPPVACIAGGPEVTRKHGSTLLFDASPSYDPDLERDTYDGMTFSWWCKRKDEIFSDTPSGVDGGCFGNGTQKLEPTNRIILLDAGEMQLSEQYDMRLTVFKDGMNSSFVQRVLIVSGKPLYVEINCMVNCDPPVNPSMETSLVAKCTNSPCFVPNAIFRHQWSLFLQSVDSWAEVDQLESMSAVAKTTSKGLTLKANTLQAGQSYRLVHAVVNLNDSSSNGSVIWPFSTSSVPTGGACSVDTASGFAAVSTLTCSNWKDPRESLLYEFRVDTDKGVSTMLSYGSASSAEVVLPEGDSSRNYSLTIDVKIINSDGAWTKYSMDTTVLPWSLDDLEDSSESARGFLDKSVRRQLRRGNIGLAAQYTVGAFRFLKHQKKDKKNKTETIKMKSSLTALMLDVEVSSLVDLNQVSSVMTLALDDPTEIEQDLMRPILESVNQMAGLHSSLSARATVDDLPLLEIAGSNLVSAAGKHLKASSAGAVGDMAQQGSHKNNTLTSLQIIHAVMDAAALPKVPGQAPTAIRTENIEAAVLRLYPEDASGYLLPMDSGAVQFPSSPDMNMLLYGAGEFVEIQAFSSRVNYLNGDPSAQSITSHILTVDLKNDSGARVSVKNLLADIGLTLPVDEQPAENSTSEREESLKPGLMQYRRVGVIKERTSLLIRVESEAAVHIFIKYGTKPTVENHEQNFTLPDFSSCTKDEDLQEYDCSSDPYTILLTNDVIKKPGVYYLGFLLSRNEDSRSDGRSRRSCFTTKRQKRSCIEIKDAPPPVGEYETVRVVYDSRTDKNYTIESEELSCRFWSKEEEQWRTEGCKVGPQSTKRQLICLCNHLTTFGGGLLVAPNPIDMDTVYKELRRLDETGNFGVLLTIILVILLYCIAVVFARRADRKDQGKTGSRILLGVNDVFSSKEYKITVSTGVRPDSGTTAQVTMVFYGSLGNSGPIVLRPDLEPSRVLLCRGNVDKFVLCLPESLGTLHHAYVWHDNSGESASWFLDYVTIRSKETGIEWNFQCNQWFAPEKDDGMIAKMISVEKKASLPKFQDKFRATLSGSLYESHLWMSSFTKRPGNSFTRVQRVTCCLCLVLTAMLANAMFYNLGGQASSTIRLGPLKFSVRQIVITIQSCLVIAPINFLIVAIFKNSRATFDRHCCAVPSVDEWYLDEEDKKPLNHIFTFVAWFLALSTAISAAAVVFSYSLVWGKETADEWISSILMSIVVDILAIQPVKLIVLAAVAAIVTTRALKTKEKLRHGKAKTEKEEACEIETPGFANATLPGPDQLEWYKNYRKKEAKAMSAILALCCFVPFIFVLGVVCYGNKDYHLFLVREEIKNIFPDAEKVSDHLGFWTWMNNIFAPGIFYRTWYNGQKEDVDVYISNKVSVLTGIPRIRQLRVNKDACAKVLESYSAASVCFPYYSKGVEDTTPMYLPGWKPVPPDTSPSSFVDLCPKPWRYQSSEETGNLPLISPRTIYGGGGYIADLGYDLQTARQVLDKLSRSGWIDRQTRAVIVEFNVFNSNLNVLIVANYFFEFLPMGGSFNHVKLQIVQSYNEDTSLFQFILLCHLILIIMILGYLVVEIRKMYRQKKSYLGNIWNWLTVMLITAAITVIVIHVLREESTKSAMKELQKNPFAPVSFHEALALVEVETILLSVVVFLSTLKLLHLVRFSKEIISLTITLRYASKYLLSFTFVFLIIFISFALCGMAAFGRSVESYSTIVRVCVSQFEFLLGKAVPRFEMGKVQPLLAFLFSVLYISSMTIFLLNVFIVILNTALDDVKNTKSDELDLALFMSVLFTKRVSGVFRKKGQKRRKLYCDNMTFEKDCSYLENRLGEINRRVSILAEDALTESRYVRLLEAKLDLSLPQKRMKVQHFRRIWFLFEDTQAADSERDDEEQLGSTDREELFSCCSSISSFAITTHCQDSEKISVTEEETRFGTDDRPISLSRIQIQENEDARL